MSDQSRLRGILWRAVSSEEQAKDDKTSLETQDREAREFADPNGLDIVDVITVGGFSRRFYNYPEFAEAAALEGFTDPARMIAHWKRRDFDVLLARDGSRLGREQGILAEFIARTVRGGARLYMNSGGWIDESKFREYIAMNGYSSSKEVDRLIKGSKATKIKNASRGLTTGSRAPYSHKWVRNDAGKLVRLELDESKRRLWDDLATLFLQGMSYRHLENTLYERYGHVHEQTGKPFALYFFHHLLHNPYFWGHAGYGYKNVRTRNGQKIGAWAYDPSCPLPEEVHIFYNVNAPVYSGELALRMQDEQRRRSETIRGKARPHGTNQFTGLLICADCGRYLTINGGRTYGCRSKDLSPTETRRNEHPFISERKVQAWLHSKLVQMMEYDLPDLLARNGNQPEYGGRITGLERELEELVEQARNLVIKQAQAHSALTSIYDEQLQLIGERITILEHALDETQREERANDTTGVEAAFRDMPTNIEDMWGWDGRTVNQLLHRLMGHRRLIIQNGQVVGTDDAPPHHRRKERKRTYFGNNRDAQFE